MRTLKTRIDDDDRELAESLAILLDLEGHQASLAYSAKQAVHNHRDKRFDLVFLDLRLPDGSGLDCLVDLRRIYPQAEVLVMTAYGVADTTGKARERGALGAVGKPLDVDHFSGALDMLARYLIPAANNEPDFAERLAAALTFRGHAVAVTQDADEAKHEARDGGSRVVVLDAGPGALDPAALGRTLADRRGQAPIVMVGGYPNPARPDYRAWPEMTLKDCFADASDTRPMWCSGWKG